MQSRIHTFINHPAGPRTIHFWAPIFKWGLVLAGIGDLARPPNTISVKQSLSLGLTGFVWSRFSLVIIPKNYSLFAVNFFLGTVGVAQVLRALHYQYFILPSETAKVDT